MRKLLDHVACRLLVEAPVALGLPAMGRRYCPVCGNRSTRGPLWKLAAELVDSWHIDARWKRLIERREGLACGACGSVSRYRYLARIIMQETSPPGLPPGSFSDYTGSAHFKQLRVAEVNGCSTLHAYLDRNPALAYSEYGSTDPAIPSEDLTRLSYRDSQFDLVLTSDTLEHVPDPGTAMAEIERVLKPGGRHIFTVPVVWDGRKTRQRAVLDGERIVHLCPPSYHGVWAARNPDRLVFHEFGDDVLDYLQSPGVEISVRRHPRNPSISVFVALKTDPATRAGSGAARRAIP